MTRRDAAQSLARSPGKAALAVRDDCGDQVVVVTVVGQPIVDAFARFYRRSIQAMTWTKSETARSKGAGFRMRTNTCSGYTAAMPAGAHRGSRHVRNNDATKMNSRGRLWLLGILILVLNYRYNAVFLK
jgi:hypothetical protein